MSLNINLMYDKFSNMNNVLKRLLIVGVLLSFGTIAFSSDLYTNKKYNYSIKGLPDWHMDTSQKGVSVAFDNVDGVSSVQVRVYLMPEIPTADGLAETMAQSKYDGWINLGGEFGDEDDIFVTGADAKYQAVHKKTVLEEKGRKTTTIVAESYYVKGQTAYIVSMVTTEYMVEEKIASLKQIANSFYIDENL
jgi:hypothetical protein